MIETTTALVLFSSMIDNVTKAREAALMNDETIPIQLKIIKVEINLNSKPCFEIIKASISYTCIFIKNFVVMMTASLRENCSTVMNGAQIRLLLWCETGLWFCCLVSTAVHKA